MKIKEDYIDKLKQYLKDLNYEGTVKEIKLLREHVNENTEDIQSRMILRDKEFDIRIANNLCRFLSDKELSVISYKYFKLLNGKHYKVSEIGDILGYSRSNLHRIEQKALEQLAYLKYGEDAVKEQSILFL